jgi:oxygen-dependent protoporphyrinogen oxidase
VEKSKDRAESFSFTEGMQMLPAALAHRLGNDLTVSCTVTGVHHDDGVYTITATESGAGRTVRSRGLIISVPAFAAAEFLAPMSRDTAEVLRSIEYSPVASVFLSYRKEDVLHPLNGFGVLIPQKERRKILGVLWSSSLFPRRAPDGLAAFTAFVGGARQPEQLTGTDEDVRAIAEEELASIMQIMGKPVYYRVTRWQKAIPQYTLGYERKMDALAGWSATHPGLALCGNYIGGISVGDCVMSARHTADQLSAFLRTVSQ